jgi:hypothetical protein
MKKGASGVLLAIALLCAAWVSPWRPQAQNQGGNAANELQRLSATARGPQPGPSERGATYVWLESRAVRTTSRFVDAVAVSERGAGGDLKTRLTDSSGRELATFAVDRGAAAGDVLTFRTGNDAMLRAVGRAASEATLDWGNRQIYALFKDQAAAPDAALEWRGDMIRRRHAPPFDFQRDTLEVRTEWPDGFAASAVRSNGQRPHPVTGQPTRGTSLESFLKRDNVEVGRSRWYPEEQVYVWSFPNLTNGFMDAERLKETGGWTFTPDLAWTNVQNYAFHYFHSTVANQGFVADMRTPSPSWLARVFDAVVPTVYANEPGCDGLHWLDSTIFRPCCDMHDACYSRAGCSWRSWWEWYSSWKCTACNIAVAYCFVSRTGPYQQSYP